MLKDLEIMLVLLNGIMIVYRLYPNHEIDSIFDIKNKIEIKDKELKEKLYNDYKNPKVKRINR